MRKAKYREETSVYWGIEKEVIPDERIARKLSSKMVGKSLSDEE